MAFVHVIDRRAKAESVEGANAADTEKDFLLDAHVEVTAVELCGDGAVLRAISRKIGIEEIELNAADDGTPNAGSEFAIGKLDADLHIGNELDRENVEVVFFAGFLLPAGGIEVLPKISFLIEKADSDQRKAEIAGGFEMVAGENTKSPGKNGETFGDAELEREVGDEEIVVLGVFTVIPGALAGEVGVQAFGDAVEVGEKGIVAGSGFEDGLFDAAQKTDRIAAGDFPEVAIEAAEKINGGVIPTPAEVIGDLQQRLQGVRQRRPNFECGDRLHGIPQRERRARGAEEIDREGWGAVESGPPRHGWG
jgi:hypothetical protein